MDCFGGEGSDDYPDILVSRIWRILPLWRSWAGVVGSPMGVKRNALSLTTLASVDGGRGEMLIGALEASRDVV